MIPKSRTQAQVRPVEQELGGELLLWSRRRSRRREHCVAMTEIGGYLERTLAPARRQAVENHVAECDACRHELVELYQLLKSPMEPAPHGLAGDVAAAVSEVLQPADRRPATKGARA